VGEEGRIVVANRWYPTDNTGRLALAAALTVAGYRPTQSKACFDRDKIEHMAESMALGIFDWHAASLQPVILGTNGEVLGGHHRIIAAFLVGTGLSAVPGPWPQIRRLPPIFPVARPVYDWADVLPDV
jgi:hypothetical protein